MKERQSCLAHVCICDGFFSRFVVVRVKPPFDDHCDINATANETLAGGGISLPKPAQHVLFRASFPVLSAICGIVRFLFLLFEPRHHLADRKAEPSFSRLSYNRSYC